MVTDKVVTTGRYHQYCGDTVPEHASLVVEL